MVDELFRFPDDSIYGTLFWIGHSEIPSTEYLVILQRWTTETAKSKSVSIERITPSKLRDLASWLIHCAEIIEVTK